MLPGDPVFVYVDDDLTSREVMHLLLVEALGYRTLTMFEDSIDFLAKLAALPAQPDVIFLDIQVKPLNGFAMLKLLRDHAAYQSTTVIAVTASVMNEEVDLLKAAGFDGVIAKPLRLRTFADIIHRILEHEKIWFIA
ncbi:MAG: response regulator [Chloroflexi bacterium]|nr:response regulator [Chloroflexota bacterium]